MSTCFFATDVIKQQLPLLGCRTTCRVSMKVTNAVDLIILCATSTWQAIAANVIFVCILWKQQYAVNSLTHASCFRSI